GRTAATGRARASPREPPGGAAPGRAPGRTRPEAPEGDAARAQGDPGPDGYHLHLRDARPGRGDDDVRHDRGDERRIRRTARIASGAVPTPAVDVRGGVHRRLEPADASGGPAGRRAPDDGPRS